MYLYIASTKTLITFDRDDVTNKSRMTYLYKYTVKSTYGVFFT